MPVVVYSVLRLALLAGSWLLLTWAGLHPLVALLVAAFVAWGLSYAALGGPRDAAARYLADRAAERAAHAGRPVLSAHAQEDAEVEDAAVDAASATVPGEETTPAGGEGDARGGGSADASRDEHGAGGGTERRAARTDGPAAPTDGPVDDTAVEPPDTAGTAQSASASPSSMP